MASTTITLPTVLLLTPPPVYHRYKTEFSRHFNFLNFSTSSLPLTDFLTSAAADGVSAMFATNLGPRITADGILKYLPSLRCIVSSTAGLDYIDLDECRRRGITVANSAGLYGDDCADAAISLLIDVFRKISSGDRFVRGGNWSVAADDYQLGHRLTGKRVGIVGLGGIGSKVAKRLQGFGCTIMYNSREKKQSVTYPYYSDVCQLAENSDALIICCALTDHTKHLINKEVLLALGKKGVIINIARGAVIDEEELIRCLIEHQIGGAGLDVFEHEPNVPKDLFAMDNVVMSPHLAACTEESFRHLYELVKGNLQAFFSNKPLLTPVL